MIYRDFQDLKLSALGFGAMRLPVLEGNDSKIDKAATLRMVDTAMENGINYYDTAWGYHGENSELVMGEALAKYLIVKYNDQVVRRVGDDGQFQRWGYDTPGYDQQFIDAIGPATGKRYQLKEIIERRER